VIEGRSCTRLCFPGDDGALNLDGTGCGQSRGASFKGCTGGGNIVNDEDALAGDYLGSCKGSVDFGLPLGSGFAHLLGVAAAAQQRAIGELERVGQAAGDEFRLVVTAGPAAAGGHRHGSDDVEFGGAEEGSEQGGQRAGDLAQAAILKPGDEFADKAIVGRADDHTIECGSILTAIADVALAAVFITTKARGWRRRAILIQTVFTDHHTFAAADQAVRWSDGSGELG